MTLSIEEIDGVTVVVVQEKRLDAAVSEIYRIEFQRLIDQGKVKLCVDLTRVEFIDSSGLNVLIGATRTSRALKGDLKIAGPQSRVKDMFEMTRVNRMIPILDNQAEAVRSFASA